MHYKVTSLRGEPREWESQNGPMLTYYLNGLLDDVEEPVQINTSKAKAKVPYVGEVIECTVSKDDPKFGKTIKRVQSAFTPQSGGQSGAKWGGSPRQDDPEKQRMIVRQNSLGNAINHSIAKAQLYMAEKKYEQAHMVLDGAKILIKAETFAKFSLGDLKVPSENEQPRSAVEVLTNVDEPPFDSSFEGFVEENMGGYDE